MTIRASVSAGSRRYSDGHYKNDFRNLRMGVDCASCSYLGTKRCTDVCNPVGTARVAKFEARYATAGVDWRAGLTAPASVRV